MELQRRMIPMESLSELLRLQMENGGRAKLTVTGDSMYPMLKNCRDSVELMPIAPQQKKGDIILYRRDNGQFILHRIIAVTEDGYICCGDNQWEKEPVRHDQLLAVVDSFTRNGKQYTLNQASYRLYVAAWLGLFPVRRYLLGIRRRLGRLRRKMQRRR